MTNPLIISNPKYFLTPLEEAYIRAHNSIPIIDPTKHTVQIFNEQTLTKTLKMDEIQNKMKQHEVMVCMRCAGHRRSEMTDMRPWGNMIRGVNYGPYAISNAVYKGPLVRDVLEQAGFNLEDIKDKWLVAEGCDIDFQGDPV